MDVVNVIEKYVVMVFVIWPSSEIIISISELHGDYRVLSSKSSMNRLTTIEERGEPMGASFICLSTGCQM